MSYRVPPTLFDRVLAVSGLLLLTEAVVPLLSVHSDPAAYDPVKGNLAFQLAAGAVYALTLPSLMLRPRQLASAIRRSWVLVLLVLLAIASPLWAASAVVASRRAIALLGTTCFALYLAVRFEPRDLLRALATALALAAWLSLLVGLLLPTMGIHQDGDHIGAWRGVYQQKNLLGRWMALAVIAIVEDLRATERRRAWHLASLTAAALCLILSRSATAMLLTLGLLAVRPLLTLARRHTAVAVTAAACLLLLLVGSVLLVGDGIDSAFGAIGKDMTLTGRTMLWSVAQASVFARPWLGYGYRSFWLGADGPSGDVWRYLNWEPATGHNSYLDLTLELGVIGLALFLLSVGVLLRRLWREWRRTSGQPLVEWHCQVLLFLLLISITHTIILSPNSAAWVLLVASFVGTRATLTTTMAGAHRRAEELSRRSPTYADRSTH